MNTKRLTMIGAACTAAALYLAGIANSSAFRMIQNNSTGRVTAGAAVACNDAGGFTYPTDTTPDWYHNTALQGSGAASALQGAMAAWTAVVGVDHTLGYAGNTSAAFVTDGQNTVVWTTDAACTGSCLALTALVLQSGQQIIESDVMFNNTYAWVSGNPDIQAVATHEFGHSLGIHHTEIGAGPTMYFQISGTGARSLEQDDRDALWCTGCAHDTCREVGFAAGNAIKLENFNEMKSIAVFRTGGSTGAIDVHFTAAHGSTNSSDWALMTSSPLHWNSGDMTAKDITVQVFNDSTPENDEYLTLNLTSSTDARLADTSITLTIICNDGFNCP